MEKGGSRKIWILLLIFLGVWLGLRYLFPIILPFLLGWGLAAMAEPGTKFLQKKLHFPRCAASGTAVTLTLALLLTLLWFLAAIGYREMTLLAKGLPGLVTELTGRIALVRDWVIALIDRVPEGLAAPVRQAVSELFAGGSVLIEKATDTLLRFAGHMVEGIPGGALLAGTAVISGYMISAQMPALAERLRQNSIWSQRIRPAVQRLRCVAGRWLKAQLKLSGITLAIVWAGFLLLRIQNSLFWAFVTALVDAVPMLGTGTILIPWSILAFLNGDTVRGVGLLGIYVTAMVTRSGLEPRMLGRQLGMNPLTTLVALYAGFQIWGVTGMILAPILVVMARELASLRD